MIYRKKEPIYHPCVGWGVEDVKDGVSNGEEVEDPSLLFTDAIEEDLFRIVKLGRPKNKAMRDLWNLSSSINYDNANVSSRWGKGMAHVM